MFVYVCVTTCLCVCVCVLALNIFIGDVKMKFMALEESGVGVIKCGHAFG